MSQSPHILPAEDGAGGAARRRAGTGFAGALDGLMSRPHQGEVARSHTRDSDRSAFRRGSRPRDDWDGLFISGDVAHCARHHLLLPPSGYLQLPAPSPADP
ncbi:MAG TPA: hypothetical protein VFI46_04325 [Jiangellaceae bacterium]|nr:hypothetical protein [Jiangellaceae bacterium]